MSKSTIRSDHGFDLDNRDPTEKNEHVRVWFEDSFAEPDGTHSIDGSWKCSYKTFNCAKGCCYIFLSVLCGGPCALIWGLLFACQSCFHIWCVGPCAKYLSIHLGCISKCWKACISCYLNPFYEACGRVFSEINFNHSYEVV